MKSKFNIKSYIEYLEIFFVPILGSWIYTVVCKICTLQETFRAFASLSGIVGLLIIVLIINLFFFKSNKEIFSCDGSKSSVEKSNLWIKRFEFFTLFLGLLNGLFAALVDCFILSEK